MEVPKTSGQFEKAVVAQSAGALRRAHPRVRRPHLLRNLQRKGLFRRNMNGGIAERLLDVGAQCHFLQPALYGKRLVLAVDKLLVQLVVLHAGIVHHIAQ